MPVVQANGIDVYYEVQGEGEPLVLIPYLAADQACYAFQVADYAKSFTCYTVDLRGAGLSGKPEGRYSTELFADDVAGFMQAAGVDRAHVAGLSLGAATGIWLAAKYPDRVASLSLHSAWQASDPFLRTVVGGWRIMAEALGSVTEMAIQGIFPWCLTPELYAARPEYIESLAEFVRKQADAPGGRVLAPVPGRARSRCAGGPGVRAGADPDHLRPPRPGDFHPVPRPPHRGDRRQHRGRRVRGLRARPDLRERRGVQPAHPGLLATPPRLAPARPLPPVREDQRPAALQRDRFAGGREYEGEAFVAENERWGEGTGTGARREPARREVVVTAAAVVDPDLADAGRRADRTAPSGTPSGSGLDRGVSVTRDHQRAAARTGSASRRAAIAASRPDQLASAGMTASSRVSSSEGAAARSRSMARWPAVIRPSPDQSQDSKCLPGQERADHRSQPRPAIPGPGWSAPTTAAAPR